jgi:hypothetical protein
LNPGVGCAIGLPFGGPIGCGIGAAIGTVAAVGVVLAVGSIPGDTPKDFVDDPQAKAEHDDYKNKYKLPPPPFKDPCDELRWKLKREEDLLRARQAWDAKWLPGRHAGMNGEIQSQNAIRKIKEKMKNQGCDCP